MLRGNEASDGTASERVGRLLPVKPNWAELLQAPPPGTRRVGPGAAILMPPALAGEEPCVGRSGAAARARTFATTRVPRTSDGEPSRKAVRARAAVTHESAHVSSRRRLVD